MPAIATRLENFTESVIREMTRVSNQHNALNLSQGFPDWDPPAELTAAASRIMKTGPHQYAVTWGAPEFRKALARKQSRCMGLDLDPDAHVVVTCGSTEAMMAAMMTACNPGDRVIVFSPFYENYGADTILTGAEPVYVPLRPPTYDFDPDELRAGFEAGAKALVLCNPSNPCGKVFTREELTCIAEMAQEYDAFV
ncbi:MAG: aminotransferase class I/II-fold pyridoxal phosphate-dependent enzyme, partial [Desulfobacterales bacterium]|nr:aminotransferase class I/II-fold pyridoxal phosphate-dependent enzyme [Desulfobacterales bacterium]